MKGGAYIGIDKRTYFEGGDLQCLKANESMCVKCASVGVLFSFKEVHLRY